MRTLMISAALIFGMATPAAAEVVSRGEDTFTLKFSARTEYGPGRIVRSLEGLPNWWDPAHTYTGDAANLSLDLRPGGCWCEKLADGTDFDHGRTVSVTIGEILFHAPFGPLRGAATRAAWTTAPIRRAAWTWVAGTPCLRSSLSWASRQAPQPLMAETAVDHNSKSSLSTPGLAMTFMRRRAGMVVYSWFFIRCSDR